MRVPLVLPGAAAMLLLSGCHSAFVDATVSNHTNEMIPLIEVDYPSASFGTENLAPGKEYHYRFKVLGDGPVSVVYTLQGQSEKHATGPVLNEGAEGPMSIVFDSAGVHWSGRPEKR